MPQINYNVERVNLYESIANNLEEMILNDSSQIGQKLPSEQTMAANFGVSRNVIREALKILKERQLITLHIGEGAYINKPGDQGVTEMLNRIVLMDNIKPENTFELRTILEVGACRLVAEKSNTVDFQPLVEVNERMRTSKDDIDQRIALDMEFHNTVARLSGNPLLELFQRSINNLIAPLIRTALLPLSGNESGIRDHQMLIEAMRKGDADQAVSLMSEHLRKSAQNYQDGELRKE